MPARLFLLLALLLPAAARAQAARAIVALAAESAAPAPGRPVALALTFTPRPGWHTYWKNPGESGIETRLTWTLPPGARAGAPDYPVPETFVVSGIMNYVYSGPATLLVAVTPPPAARAGDALPVRLKADYLVCDDELCVPESAELALDLRLGDGASDPVRAALFARARAALPVPLAGAATFAREGGRFRLAAPVPAGPERAYFFPLTEGALDLAAPQRAGRAGDRLVIETKAGAAAPGEVAGVLRVERDAGPPLGYALTARPGPVPALDAAEAATAESGSATPGLPLAFVLAVAGGLVLNVMPCVFPVLSLKALGLARAGDERAARGEALAYTGGVLVTMLALGGVILALRAGGGSAGWALWLQDARVVALLLALVTAIALNLAGLFEVRLGGAGAGQRLAGQGGRAGAFWTGLLAVVVATPCTAPFMGAALGATLVLPPAAGMLIFAGLGLGFALPFLLLGFVPALRRALPRPGSWMERFRRVLAVPMLLTAVWLAWVLGQLTGVAGMTVGLLGALAAGVALWWLGSRQRGGGAGWPGAATALAAAALAAWSVPRDSAPAQATGAAGPLAALPFSEAALAQARARGPTFVYFTADWCVNCKVNERGAMSARAVRAAFARAGVTTLVGDWTRGDPAITRFLAKHGRNGVPLYLFYYPDGRVETLPQILTPGRLSGLV